ncbi:hypothetical protein GOV13_00635 [Candidatus Pacearchaeota archaeon]|nr:hypothetical protein [Candidatus Pacearchaeota archaeon]
MYFDAQKEIIRKSREIVISYRNGKVPYSEVKDFLNEHLDIFEIKNLRDDIQSLNKARAKYHEAGKHFFGIDRKIGEELLNLVIKTKD